MNISREPVPKLTAPPNTLPPKKNFDANPVKNPTTLLSTTFFPILTLVVLIPYTCLSRNFWYLLNALEVSSLSDSALIPPTALLFKTSLPISRVPAILDIPA